MQLIVWRCGAKTLVSYLSLSSLQTSGPLSLRYLYFEAVLNRRISNCKQLFHHL